jgi:hypothetical protein
MKHLVQFYGRWPKEEDRTSFLTQLQAQPEVPELGLLLGPIPQQKITVPIDGKSPMAFVDSGEEYVSTLERYITQTALPSNPPAERSAVLEKKFGAPLSAPGMHSAPKPIAFRPRRKGLIISGAFPDNVTAQAQQDLIDAVHAFTHAVFDRGGIVIFGAHPFFVPLIFDMARRKREKDFREAVHLYFSTFFRDLPQEYKDNATTFSIPPVNNDRNASLRAMREAMMADPQAAGLVAVGGRHPRPDIKPGVDEEIGLAKETDLPIFLIGSVQGRSCALAAELNANKWKDRKNPLSVEENEQLRTSLDFSSLAAMVLNSLGI